MRTQLVKNIAMVTVVTVMSLVSANETKAQYYLDYGPGSPAWCYQMQQSENAIRMQNAMMQQQILNYYQQQASGATWHMQTRPSYQCREYRPTMALISTMEKATIPRR